MTVHGLDSVVAGVRCRDVLAELSEYLDGSLPPSRVAVLQAHLAGCDNCARFGGHIADNLAALRRYRVPPREDIAARILSRITESGP